MNQEITSAVMQIIGSILMLGATVFGIWAQRLAKKWLNNDTKRQLAEYAVMAVEQMYKTLHGEEKLAQAMVLFSEQLAEKNIYVSESEMRLLLESAVGKFNEAFKKNETNEDEVEPEIESDKN